MRNLRGWRSEMSYFFLCWAIFGLLFFWRGKEDDGLRKRNRY